MDEARARYSAAAAVLPPVLRQAAMTLPPQEQSRAEEFRLRAGQVMTVLLPAGERPLGIRVEQEMLETLWDLATDHSRYAAAEAARAGYLSVRGGFRVGLCGTALMRDGVCQGLRDLSAVSVRIGRECRGIASALVSSLFERDEFQSTLLLSPPGGGKTTLLRDLVRCISAGEGCPPRRVALVDERGEVAVTWRGVPQMDVGPRTDVLDGCPKAVGIPMVLRAMNPQVIAVDEITVQEDLTAAAHAAGCGVGLLATIHAATAQELTEKPLYRELLSQGVFRRCVRIEKTRLGRRYRMEALPC